MTEPDQGQLDDLEPHPGDQPAADRARRRSMTRCAGLPTWPRRRLPIIMIGSRRPTKCCMRHWTDPTDQPDECGASLNCD